MTNDDQMVTLVKAIIEAINNQAKQKHLSKLSKYQLKRNQHKKKKIAFLIK